MKTFFQIFSILTKRTQLMGILLVVSMLVGAVLEAFGIGAMLPLLTMMSDTDYFENNPHVLEAVNSIGIDTHIDFVIFMSVALIVLYFIKNVYVAFQTKWQIDFSMNNQILYSCELFRNYMTKPYSFFLYTNSATLLKNVNLVGNAVFTNMLYPLLAIFTEVITILVIWIMLLVLDPVSLVVSSLFMFVVLYIVIKKIRGIIENQGAIQNAQAAMYLKWLNQGISGIKECKVLRKEDYFCNQFSKAYDLYGRAYGKFSFSVQLPRSIIEFIVVTGLVSLIIIKLYLGDSTSEIVALMGVLCMAAFRIMPSVNRIVGYYNSIKFHKPFFDEVYNELIEIRNRLENSQSTDKLVLENRISFNNNLVFSNLSYRYEGSDTDILHELNLEIKKGDFVGIIGPSGAGKTTFVDVILGLLAPCKGGIICDGVNIESDISDWQSKLSYVPQEIYLIDGTIRENIALGISESDIDNIYVDKVIKMAELSEYINTLPEGLNTVVGERGVRLSGGQRQRIGIARALYQKPDILILDEATSALDNETEKAITDTILKFKGKITIIAIAHRVSTLEACDYKIKLENGKAEIVY